MRLLRLLHAGIDVTVIALWLGHQSLETTQIYLHADMTIKEQALPAPRPPAPNPAATSPPLTNC